MGISKGVVLLTLLVGNHTLFSRRPYSSQHHTHQEQVLLKNVQKAIVAGLLISGLCVWQRARICHGARYVRFGFHHSDRDECYQCEQRIPTVMGDCGYGLCRNCFEELCIASYCVDCTADGYCDVCENAYLQSWAQWYFEWKRFHCPTCYSGLKQVEIE